ncbi:hypothetical protein [Candidatus Colwellia aromaticivorans]|uniref:hypothetical protein n=1 Tax=Candidatus Colwellia aromaticivorans TaxID=2267621 RepID=UPI000DF38C18|nr:hypothetical protein [Candidatus Colwellia aromaticivorans]
MPPLRFFPRSNKAFIALCCTQLLSISAQANDLEITSMLGYTFSPKLTSDDNTVDIAITNDPNVALAFSWQDSTPGQGQILVNYISRDFTDNIDQSTHSFDTLYAHFNGVAFFKERNYITTVGMGVGATYFNSDFDSVIYPSITVAVGTRYEFSDNLAFITELRAYATLTKDDNTVFCRNGTCLAHFDGTVWVDSHISIGLAYSF